MPGERLLPCHRISVALLNRYRSDFILQQNCFSEIQRRCWKRYGVSIGNVSPKSSPETCSWCAALQELNFNTTSTNICFSTNCNTTGEAPQYWVLYMLGKHCEQNCCNSKKLLLPFESTQSMIFLFFFQITHTLSITYSSALCSRFRLHQSVISLKNIYSQLAQWEQMKMLAHYTFSIHVLFSYELLYSCFFIIHNCKQQVASFPSKTLNIKQF